MFVFFDGAIITALVLFVALVLGAYSEIRPDWLIFRNDYAAMAVAVAIACGLVVGGVTSAIAGAEQQLPILAWISAYAAIQAGTVVFFGIIRPLLFRQRPLAIT